jgi:hypothetical protein
MSERLKVNEGEFYFVYNPNFNRRLTYVRRGNYLVCVIDGHKIAYDFVGAKKEEIKGIKDTIRLLEKQIKKREELIKKELGK